MPGGFSCGKNQCRCFPSIHSREVSICRTSRERAGHGRRQLRGDVLQSVLAALRALLLDGRHQRPAYAYAVGPKGQSLKNIHTVFKRSVYKNRDLSLDGLYNFRQNHQCRHRRGHNPVVVGDQDPPTPASKHFWASWALSTPLMRKGSLVRLQ